MRRLLSAVLAAGITIALLVAAGPQALACSCAAGDPRGAVAVSDAAIVGTLERVDPVRPDGRRPFRFRLEKAVKGRFGPTVDVIAMGGDGASCGLEIRVGQRTGLLLERSGGAWTASLCSEVDADMLIAASLPLPKPDGTPPAVLVAGLTLGDVRMVALDRNGRTIAYGRGGRGVHVISVCPGGRLVAAWGGDGVTGWVVVREVATMRLIAEFAVNDTLPEPGLAVGEVACLDEGARDIVLFATEGWPDAKGEIIVLRDRAVARRTRGAWKAASFHGTTAYVTGGSRGHTIEAVDLRSGVVRTLAQIGALARNEEVGRATPSPNGRVLAAIAWAPAEGGPPKPSRVLLVDLADRARVSSTPLPEASGEDPIAWLGTERFVVATSEKAFVFDTELRRVGSFTNWTAGRPEVAGRVAFGLAGSEILAVTLPSGPVRRVRKLDTSMTSAIALVPGTLVNAVSGPVVTPPPEETIPGQPPARAAGKPGSSPRASLLPILAFAVLFVGTPLTVLLVRRLRPGE